MVSLEDIKRQRSMNLRNPQKIENKLKNQLNIQTKVTENQNIRLTQVTTKSNKKETTKKKQIIEVENQKITEPITIPQNKPIERDTIFSEKTRTILTKGKNIILGSPQCGACKMQKKFIDGEFPTTNYKIDPIIDRKGNVIDINLKIEKGWTNYQQSLEINQKSFEKIKKIKNNMDKTLPKVEKMLSNNTIELQNLALKLKSVNNREEKAQIKQRMAEINENTKVLNKFIERKKDVDSNYKEINYYTKLNKYITDPNLNYEEIRQRYEMVYVDTKEGEELSDIYGLEAYPTFLNQNCSVTIDTSQKLKKKDGLLKDCRTDGMKAPLRLISYDAEQKGNEEVAEKIRNIQKLIQKEMEG